MLAHFVRTRTHMHTHTPHGTVQHKCASTQSEHYAVFLLVSCMRPAIIQIFWIYVTLYNQPRTCLFIEQLKNQRK